MVAWCGVGDKVNDVFISFNIAVTEVELSIVQILT
jgi:hypothetical protein